MSDGIFILKQFYVTDPTITHLGIYWRTEDSRRDEFIREWRGHYDSREITPLNEHIYLQGFVPLKLIWKNQEACFKMDVSHEDR